jgi:DNA polymerase (family X)
MPIHNADIARQFETAADLLEIKGDNPFRIRAYRNAVRVIEDLPHELATWVAEDHDLSALPGIGKDLAEKIKEIVETGQSVALEKLRRELPPHITDLLNLPGLGPKRVRKLYADLKVVDLETLKQAAEAGRIRELPGLGAKTEKQILESIKAHADTSQRFLRATVMPYVESLRAHLSQCPGLRKIDTAGSYRRGRDTIGDLDFLVWADEPAAIMDHFIAFDEVEEVLAHGETKSSVRLRSRIQVDLRVVPEASYGAALHYFTGSKAHNIAMRKLAQQRQWKLNEYGLFDGDTALAGKTEDEVFAKLDLPYIAPELRENRGEIEAAAQGQLPDLISLADIRGNLHAHSRWSDGKNTIREMAESARDAGHEYIAITDHSQRLTVANGLSEERLLAQIEEIDAVAEELSGIAILKGIEVDILEDGQLDLPDTVLRLLDVVIVAVHSKFNLPSEKQTERIMRAMDNPWTTFVAHPTGRLLLSRPPYAVDMARLIQHAAGRGCFLELNAHPERLDLNENYCQLARQQGVPIVINTDAHSISDHRQMEHGIAQARRGWLEAKDVVNTRSLPDVRALLAATRHHA